VYGEAESERFLATKPNDKPEQMGGYKLGWQWNLSEFKGKKAECRHQFSLNQENGNTQNETDLVKGKKVHPCCPPTTGQWERGGEILVMLN